VIEGYLAMRSKQCSGSEMKEEDEKDKAFRVPSL